MFLLPRTLDRTCRRASQLELLITHTSCLGLFCFVCFTLFGLLIRNCFWHRGRQKKTLHGLELSFYDTIRFCIEYQRSKYISEVFQKSMYDAVLLYNLLSISHGLTEFVSTVFCFFCFLDMCIYADVDDPAQEQYRFFFCFTDGSRREGGGKNVLIRRSEPIRAFREHSS